MQALQFDKRVWLDRTKRMFAGFDKPLALVAFLLLCVGIATLYSASIDVPGRVEDQLRNIMLTFVLMWILANVPPPTPSNASEWEAVHRCSRPTDGTALSAPLPQALQLH